MSDIAKAITEGFKLISQILSGREINRLKYRLESAEQYVFLDEKSGEYKDVSDKKREELKLHYRKRIFDSN